jgi:exopolyphosphatase/guanosine-5'-triphosphate,3'-diphosphate pyrophosphatase
MLTHTATPLCAIDVGTNSVKCLIARAGKHGHLETVLDTLAITRLGEGLHASGVLGDVPVERTARAVADFAAASKRAGAARVRLTGTSAVREARNGDFLMDRIRELCGLELEVLSGEDEARLSFLGATCDVSGAVLMLDVGGGSTEWATGNAGRLSWQRSYPMGAVRLTEAFLRSDPPSPNELRDALLAAETVFHDAPRLAEIEVVGVGGTVHALASVALGGAGEVEGFLLTDSELERQLKMFACVPTMQRREIPGLPANRADIQVAGVLILGAAMRRAGTRQVRCTCRGLRHGSLVQMAREIG